MVMEKRQTAVSKAYVCRECRALRSRRYDLKKHLVEKHGYSEEQAKQVAGDTPMMWEERTSRVYHSEESSRYARQLKECEP